MFRQFEARHNKKRFLIDEDLPVVGAYLYVFQGKKCIRDVLKDDVEACRQMAFEEYGVPPDAWTLMKTD